MAASDLVSVTMPHSFENYNDYDNIFNQQDTCELVIIAQSHDHLHVEFLLHVLMMMMIIVILVIILKFKLSNDTD